MPVTSSAVTGLVLYEGRQRRGRVGGAGRAAGAYDLVDGLLDQLVDGGGDAVETAEEDDLAGEVVDLDVAGATGEALVGRAASAMPVGRGVEGEALGPDRLEMLAAGDQGDAYACLVEVCPPMTPPTAPAP